MVNKSSKKTPRNTPSSSLQRASTPDYENISPLTSDDDQPIVNNYMGMNMSLNNTKRKHPVTGKTIQIPPGIRGIQLLNAIDIGTRTRNPVDINRINNLIHQNNNLLSRVGVSPSRNPYAEQANV